MADQGRMVKMWFGKASEDLKTAKLLLLQKSETFLGASVFHSQQAAEKSIKGFLAFHKVRFAKTHNMEILTNLVAKIDSALSIELQPTAILTKYATAYRYPEEVEPPKPLTQQNCEEAAALAEKVFNEMFKRCEL